MNSRFALGALVALVLAPAPRAQCPSQIGKLVSSDPGSTGGQRFGIDVAARDGRAVVGVDHRDMAYVFERDDSDAWVEVAQLTSPLPVADFSFGDHVAIGRNTIAVRGLAYAGGGGIYAASVHLFERRPDQSWRTTQSIQPVVAAAFTDDTLVAAGGSLLQFVQRGPEGWAPVQSFDLGHSYWDGLAVAANGDTAMVGAGQHHASCRLCPSVPVRVYQRREGKWQFAQELFESDGPGASGMGFGWSVDVLGDTAVVTRPGSTLPGSTLPFSPSSGAVFVYERRQGRWWRAAELHGQLPEDLFGRDAALAPGRVFVGAPGAGGPLGSGSVFEFRLVRGAWTFVCELESNNPSAWDGLGEALAFDGSTLLAGCPGDDTLTQGPDSGSVIVFSGAQ